MKLTISVALSYFAVLGLAHGDSLELTPEMRAAMERTHHELNSIVSHTNYLIQIDATWVTNAPSWKPDMDNPPLSSRAALQAAREELARTRPNATSWNFQFLSLKSFSPEKWYYVAEFSRVSDQQYEPGCYYFDSIRIAIAMNGKTLTPDLTKPGKATDSSQRGHGTH